VAEVFQQLASALEKSRATRVRSTGLSGASRAWVLSRLSARLKTPLVCITADDDAADALASDLAFFMGGEGTKPDPTVLRLPADEVLPWDELLPDAGLVTERLCTLFHLARGTSFPALVLSARALHRKVLPPSLMRQQSRTVKLNEDVGRDALALTLAGMGFRNAPLVEDPGTFSLRGDIVDLWAPLHDEPTRLEFFGDTVESMRRFDPETQRTSDKLTELQLFPARELFLSAETKARAIESIRDLAEHQRVPSSKVRERVEQVREGMASAGLESLLPGFFPGGLATVFDYLSSWSDAPVFWFDEPATQSQVLDDLFVDVERSYDDATRRQELTMPPGEHFLSRDEVKTRLEVFHRVEGGGLSIDERIDERAPVAFHFGGTKDLREAIRSHHGEEGALTPLLTRLNAWHDQKVLTAIACGSKGQAERLERLLKERGVKVKTHAKPLKDEPSELFDAKRLAHLFLGEVSAGFIDTPGKLVVLSDEDIFGSRARRRVRRRRTDVTGFVASFQDLKEGDLCVHAEFGVCRYTGLVTMQVGGLNADFLVLEFAAKDKVYLPVSRMRLLSKFTGGDPEKIALDRLGTNSWEKKKQLVREQLLQMAAELLRLYAERRAHAGHAFPPPDRYYRQFEADFEFEATVDQQKAIDDVLGDMAKPVPMERLVCGDVGYGKTEVAMRAAFKCVLDRKQVAVLVPTTLLAHQHFNSFKRRFDGYPVTVEVVSGLRKPSEVRDIMKRAQEGRVDVVVGTHKLLAGDVAFRDLGLIVIDEEQKFGVKQKEYLRRLKTNVDTLTLTATPIPRTLNMAMSGMRDMSLITTPPADRRAIRTFVNRFDPQLLKDAITRELQRGGQVFVVHNRISSLPSMEKLLNELVPHAVVSVAHGQMGEGELERVMLDFVEKRAQILLSTSIIESGLDIPSANTIIVNRADQFGLGQLYQMRGRVGRSKERAYAYLLVPQGRGVGKDAMRRLEVLQAFTELGAGFSIAAHDLEIRGAGNLLGKEQSGSIEAVGFDLYSQMLEEAVAEVRGEPVRTHIEPEVNLPVPAYLPDHYVPDVHQRLVLYKRFSQAPHPDDLNDLRAELVDRFGDAPDEVDMLHELMMLKIDLRELQLRALDGGAGRIVVTLGADAQLDGHKVAAMVQRSKSLYRLTPDLKLVAKLDPSVKGKDFIPAARKVVRDLMACERRN
jgi:transcription-repair coupling factor (superfamily II helicase)